MNNERYLCKHIKATDFENTLNRTSTSVTHRKLCNKAILRWIHSKNLKISKVGSKINKIIESSHRKIQQPKVKREIKLLLLSKVLFQERDTYTRIPHLSVEKTNVQRYKLFEVRREINNHKLV